VVQEEKKMKGLILMSAAALCFAAAPAFAQHPHGGPAGTPGAAAGSNGPATGGNGAGHSGADMSKGASSSSPTTLLTNNTKLDSKLTSNLQSKGLLPAGTDLKDACSGFKNLGQCVAALHVSHNLNVPFACMKADMTGSTPATGTTCPAGTGSSKLSLGKSIQSLSPNADAKAQSKNAQKQSDSDIKDAQTES
jgi:hypothetical protein